MTPGQKVIMKSTGNVFVYIEQHESVPEAGYFESVRCGTRTARYLKEFRVMPLMDFQFMED